MSDNEVYFNAVRQMEDAIDDGPEAFGFAPDDWPTYRGRRIDINVLRYLSDVSRCKIDPVYRKTCDPENLFDQDEWEYENA